MARLIRPELRGETPAALSLIGTRLSLLGGFSVSRGGRHMRLPAGAERLVAFLALSDGTLPRSRAYAAFWPDSSESRAAANLRSTVWRIRRQAPWLIEDGPGLRLAPGIEADVEEARHLANRLRDTSWLGDLDIDPAPFLVDLLPDWYDDWVILERERYRQLRLHALEALSRLLADRDRYAEAIDVGLAAVACEPLRESAHRVLIRTHLAEGNVAEAARQYRSYRRMLQEELGVEPSEELGRLVGVTAR